jgi:hypothetical protein
MESFCTISGLASRNQSAGPMSFDTHIYPLLLTLLGAVLSWLWQVVRNNFVYGSNAKLLGDWKSCWTDSTDPGKWVTETVNLSVKWGQIVISNSSSSGGYQWRGSGELHDQGRYFFGTWKSVRPGSNSTGVFSFFVLSQGDAIVGTAFGPDKKSNIIVSHWAMGRNDEALNSAKCWLRDQSPSRFRW